MEKSDFDVWGEEEKKINKMFSKLHISFSLSADSYGHIEPDMVPFWHLGHLVASFVMLNESNENTLYNLAQVSKLQQLVRGFC